MPISRPREGNLAIPISTLIATLSRALDLTEGEPLGHAIRSCWIGMQLAERMELGETERVDLFYALLLKDAGCTVNAAEVSDWFGVDDRQAKYDLKEINWSRLAESVRYAIRHAKPGGTLGRRLSQLFALARRGPKVARQLVEMRCFRGADVVRRLGWVNLAPDAVLNLDEHWDGSGHPRGLRGEEIPLLARILQIAQTADVFYTRHGRNGLVQVLQARRGTWFDPQLADALVDLANHREFGDRMAKGFSPADVTGFDPSPSPPVLTSLNALLPIAQVFAEIVDAKSPWTSQHSVRTAQYAQMIAKALGQTPEQQNQVTLAGFYHDLGKLGISNLILDKPDGLTAPEWQSVMRHPALTYELLAPLQPLEEIARIAGAHHERLDGSGYHQGLVGDAIPEPATIVAVADVFDALTSARPYKPAFDCDEAWRVMAPDVGSKLSAAAFWGLKEATRTGLPEAWRSPSA